MKKIKKIKLNKIAALAIIVSVSGSGSTAYAITLSNNKSSNSNTTNSQHYKNSIHIKRKLDILVTSGSINKFQEATVLKYLGTYKQSPRNPYIDRLSPTGMIPKSQEIIISNLFATYKNSIAKAIKDDFSSKLDNLINLNTITQLQKNAIITINTINIANREELLDLTPLVNNEIISKDQEISILDSFMHSKKTITKNINDILLLKLDKLISEGTINADQRTAVLNLTSTQAIDSQRLELHRRLDTLVVLGTITKDNETQIINTLLACTNKLK